MTIKTPRNPYRSRHLEIPITHVGNLKFVLKTHADGVTLTHFRSVLLTRWEALLYAIGLRRRPRITLPIAYEAVEPLMYTLWLLRDPPPAIPYAHASAQIECFARRVGATQELRADDLHDTRAAARWVFTDAQLADFVNQVETSLTIHLTTWSR